MSLRNLLTQAPSKLLRIGILCFLWAAYGLVLYSTYETDACPPAVEHREAIQCGLLAPLVLTANLLGCIPSGGSTVGIAICILLAYPALAIVLLRSRTLQRLVVISSALAMLSGLGLWCTFYLYVHSGG